MKKLVVFSCQRYIIFICSRGTREGRKRPTPMRETGTLPNASAIKRTPRPLTLGLAKDSMSMLEDT